MSRIATREPLRRSMTRTEPAASRRGRRTIHKGVAMRTAKWMFGTVAVLSAAVVPCSGQAEGLKADSDRVPWDRWQARVSVGAVAAPWRVDTADRAGQSPGSLSLMGDYYFSRSIASGGIASGFRATSGLIIGPRTALWSGRPSLSTPGTWRVDRRLFGTPAPLLYGGEPESATLPYVGIGYSGLSLRGGWSVNADLGVVAFTPSSAVKLGRVFQGTQGLDDRLRELKLSPVIQLGVSYSF